MESDELQKHGLLAPSRASSETAFDDEWDSPSSPRRANWSSEKKRFLRCLPRWSRVPLILGFIDFVIVGSLVTLFYPLITLLVYNEELFGARLALPVDTASYTPLKPDQQVIPRIFHQTTKNATIREEWREAHQSCQEAYSDFEYMHWTDEKARDFIQEEYPWFVETWDNYPFPIERADAIRYFVLYHYGGLYLDADTWCNATIPLDFIEAQNPGEEHHAVFKSTTPTGISNDLLITTAKHPVYYEAINQLQFYDSITQPLKSISPHSAVMLSAGPFFMTLVAKGWLEKLPSLPSPLLQVVNATQLLPYMTDLEAQSWHKGDTKVLEWLGERRWIWYMLMAIGTAIGLYIINLGLLKFGRYVMGRYQDELANPSSDENKVAKLA